MEEIAQAAEPAAAEKPAQAAKTRTSLRESVQSFLVTIILALFGTSFVVQAFKIPSQSMEPTLLVGDHLLVNKFIFEGRGAWYERVLPYRPVRRGDIIVFKFPYQDHTHYVKRVIGIPGDRIRIAEEKVFVNGKVLSEPYVVHDSAAYDPFGENFPPRERLFFQGAVLHDWAEQISRYVENGELVVPPEHFFVMGDNRDHSWDSRYWGFVDRDAIMGRPVAIYWSLEESDGDNSGGSVGSRLLDLGQTLLRLPARTRWRRMLREVH